MATDLTQMPLEILVDLINETNGCALITTDITFSPPLAQIAGSRNTGLTITATPLSPYSGFRDVTYNRIDLATVPGRRVRDFPKGFALTARDLVPALNLAYQLNLQPEDYYNDPLPASDPEVGDFELFSLRAKPGSFIYRGVLELSIFGDSINLGNLLTAPNLHGFILQGQSDPDSFLDIPNLDGLDYP